MEPTQLLIQNANVIDGTGAKPRKASVLVVGDKIQAVGKAADAAAAPTAQRLDAAGLSLMPGIIDGHVHSTFDDAAGHDELFFHRRPGMAAITAVRNLRKILTSGCTGIFDPDSLFDLGVDMKEAINHGVIEGPRMAVGGYALMTSVGGAAGRLMPDKGIMAYAVLLQGKDQIMAEVRRQIKIGCDWIKVHVTGSLSHRRSEGEMVTFTMDELRTHLRPGPQLWRAGDGPLPWRAFDQGRLQSAGFDQIAHATLMDDAALDAVVKHQVHLVPALTFQANLMEFGDAINASPALQDIFRKEIEDSAAMLAKAFRAGVPVLTGSESGFSVTPYGDWHYRELEVFVKYLGPHAPGSHPLRHQGRRAGPAHEGQGRHHRGRAPGRPAADRRRPVQGRHGDRPARQAAHGHEGRQVHRPDPHRSRTHPAARMARP